MSPRTVRAVALAVCAAGTAGMIVTQVSGSNDATIVFGMMTSAAALVLIATTATTSYLQRPPAIDDASAALLENRIYEALASGAAESVVNDLVQAAIEFGRESVRRS